MGMDAACWLTHRPMLFCMAQEHLPRDGTAHTGWTLLHLLTIKTISTGMFPGRSALGNTSTEAFFSDDATLRQPNNES